MSEKLKLLAETKDDLGIIAAALQDAIVRIGGIHFDKTRQTLVMTASRFCHEAEDPTRIQSGLGIHNVLSVQMKGINRADPNSFMVLLEMAFVPADEPPSGYVHLIFAGGGEILAHIECLEVRLIDMQNQHKTKSIPVHPLDE